jgi:hypothetical protein
MAKTTQEEPLKKLLICAGAAFLLSGCVTLIDPPESSFNGLYLQMYKVKGPFVMQIELKEQAECAFLAANAYSLSFGLADRVEGFCTKTPNKSANIKSWVTINEVKTAYAMSFDSIAECTRVMEEGIKNSSITVHRYCYKAT